MPLTKSSVILIIFTIITASTLSGCVLDDLVGGTDFSLSSWTITDDNGFPALSITYSCTGTVTAEISGPSYSTSSSDDSPSLFLKGGGDANLCLGPYRETIPAGKYKLTVKDNDKKSIYTKSYTIKGEDVTILSCEQKWWTKGDVTMLIGLTMNVKNNGDIPVYPYQVSVAIDSEAYDGLVIPKAILPDESESISCSIYKKEGPTDDTIKVTLYDINGNILTSESYYVDLTSDVSTRSFSKGLDNTLYVPYPDFLYDYYHNLERVEHEDYSYYIFDQYDDVFMDLFVDRLISTLPFGEYNFNSKSDVEKVDFINSFTQNLDYILDSEFDKEIEYPNYPVETLFNTRCGGDCEDKAILTACLIQEIGFKSALFRLPNHMATGVELGESDVSYDFYYGNYYFIETTTTNNPIGYVSKEEYKNNAELTVYEIISRPLLVHGWDGGNLVIYSNTELGDFVKVTTIIENAGLTTATNFKVKGVFTTDYGLVQRTEESTVDSLEPGKKTKVTLKINIPKTLKTWFKTDIELDGEVVDTRQSKSYFDPEDL